MQCTRVTLLHASGRWAVRPDHAPSLNRHSDICCVSAGLAHPRHLALPPVLAPLERRILILRHLILRPAQLIAAYRTPRQ